MVKLNDKVYHVYDLGMRGIVVGVTQEKAKHWLVGGASEGRLIAQIRREDGSVVAVPAADLMRED
jgi:hypothetical protein